MRKTLMLVVCSFVSSMVYAGGSLGGGGFGVQDEVALMSVAYNIEALPKAYVSGDDFRRYNARLSVAGTNTIPARVGDESIDLRIFNGHLVDLKISKEILEVDGGSTGGSPGVQ
jgi:hypothetical protein